MKKGRSQRALLSPFSLEMVFKVTWDHGSILSKSHSVFCFCAFLDDHSYQLSTQRDFTERRCQILMVS